MELFASTDAWLSGLSYYALEAGLAGQVRFVKDKKTDEGGDYLAIAGQWLRAGSPARRRAGTNEGPSVLQYLARKPESGLAPAWGSFERYELIDTLNYLAPAAQAHLYQLFARPRRGRQAGGPGAENRRSITSSRLGDRDTLVGNQITGPTPIS